ncbi:MAG: tRNA preQ1(34) S-adenosylmethionine ribosyltransferase-isomerase QueA [Clostridia bacterium]|nr:tRNA preQ1(34) S-adenosylmethionine ribosyltransferase-isomerase QueA [Clostridia bacterium]
MIVNQRPETTLLTSDFSYELPHRLIAQTPAEPRDSSRLMVLDRQTGAIAHRIFRDVTDYLLPTDTLVVNDSRVIPARLRGKTDDGTGRDIELLLLSPRGADRWETLVRPGKRAKPGDAFAFAEGALRAVVEEVKEDGNRIVRFSYDDPAGFYAVLDRAGETPLPPYIETPCADPERYQTVYARERGSAAAPTAGLHFTEELLGRIRAKGVAVVPVMLHVGLGTFRPVKTERIAEHTMHAEFFTVTKKAADTINERKRAGGRIICVGTTSCRTLESAADEDGTIRPQSGETGIFIYPGYHFKAMDGLITNFHLPESTLIMLVSAFAGKEKVMEAYRTAVREEYRFFSFGDAMLIL